MRFAWPSNIFHGIEIAGMRCHSLAGLEEITGTKTAGFLAVYASSFLGRNSLVCLFLRPGPPVGPDGRCGSSSHPALSLGETSVVLCTAIASEAREVVTDLPFLFLLYQDHI